MSISLFTMQNDKEIFFLIKLSVSADPNLNIALGKTASLSSHDRRWGEPASAVVDGNRYGRFIHTHYENRPWVKIDLLREVLLDVLTWLLN